MPAAMTNSNGWSSGSKKTLLNTSRDHRIGNRPPQDTLKRREESIFVKRAKQEAKRRQRQKENRFFVFVLSAVIAMLILAAHFTYEAVVGHLPELHMAGMGLGYNRANDVSSFQLAGVSPGMTPAMVRKAHDKAEVRVTDSNVTLSSFTFRDADVTVWHLDQANGQLAFRIRSSQTFTAAQEEDVLKALGRKFGRPISDSCENSRITGIKDCRFAWRADSIDLKAITRQTPDGMLSLTLQAEDVQLRSLLEKAEK